MKLLAPSTNWLIAAAVSFVVAGCASTGAKPQAAPATADSPEPGKGLVIFYRESHFKGGGVGFIVRDLHQLPSDTSLGSGPKIGALPNGSLFVFNATPGKHTFAGEVTSRIGSWSYRTMNIESNHVYYVRADLWGASIGVPSLPELTVVDSQKGSAAIKNLRRVSLSQ